MAKRANMLSVTASAPTAGANTVYVPGGGSGSDLAGVLCAAHGNAVYPDYAGITGVYGLVKQGGAGTTATDNEIITNGVLCPMTGSGSWNLDARLPAWANMTAPYADNTFFALNVYSLFDYVTYHYVPYKEHATVSFTGQGSAADCARVAVATLAAPAALVPAPQEIHPVLRDEGWLYYPNISAAALSLGSTLMLEGAPLSARLIAVAAADIYWWHGNGKRQIVNRAIGDARLNSSHDWTFPDVLQNGIALSHLTFNPDLEFAVHAVTSECRDHANLFSVDPDQIIKVQVNFNHTETTSRTGGYGLWVKVIE